MTKYLMYNYQRQYVHIYTKHMKFLCLTMWPGGPYTTNTDDNVDDDGQSMTA